MNNRELDQVRALAALRKPDAVRNAMEYASPKDFEELDRIDGDLAFAFSRPGGEVLIAGLAYDRLQILTRLIKAYLGQGYDM